MQINERYIDNDIFIDIIVSISIKYKYVKQKNKIMKRLIMRSLRVALVLAIFCVSVCLTIFKSPFFFILILLSIFFMDAVDSMLVWRLKRIEDSRVRNIFIHVYLAVTLIALGSCGYALKCRDSLKMSDLNIFIWILYSILVMVFSFRYFVIVVRVMVKYFRHRWRVKVLAVVY